MLFEDQGKGVLFSHMVIAEEYLKQNKKPINDENLKKTIMKLAREKAESYTPSEELGRNPDSRVSPDIKAAMAPWLYGKNSIINKLNIPPTERRDTMIELNGAINHLTQILLKRVYKFKTTRAPNVKKDDPNLLTDFEYLASGPDGMSREDRQKYNTKIDVNRQIRGMVQAYITAALIPILSDDKNSIYKKFSEMYINASPSLIRSKNVYKNFMKNLAQKFFVTFGSTKISDYMRNFKVTPKGNLELPKKKK